MDVDAQRKKRLEAIEEKKRRLEEMKKARDRRESGGGASFLPTDLVPSADVTSGGDINSALGRLSISRGDLRAPLTIEPSRPSTSTTDVDSLLKSILGDKANKSEASPSTESVKSEPPPPSPPIVREKTRAEIVRERSAALKMTHLVSIHIPSTSVELYDKEIQTEEAQTSVDSEGEDEMRSKQPLQKKQSFAFRNVKSPVKHQSSDMHAQFDSESKQLQFDTSDDMNQETRTKKFSESEIANIITDNKFLEFFQTTSRIVERSLASTSKNINILENFRFDSNASMNSVQSDINLDANYDFHCGNITSGRSIMDIQACPQHRELVLVCFGSKSSTRSLSVFSNASNATSAQDDLDSPGLVVIWSIITPNRPEFILSANFPVLCARFVEGSPHLVVGGCYNGQVLVWDTRSNKGRKGLNIIAPAQRSNLTGRGHRYPVYAMLPVPSSAEYLSLSTDGIVCLWDSNRVSEPVTNYSISASGNGSPGVNSSTMAISFDEHRAPFVMAGFGSGHLARFAHPYRGDDSVEWVEAHNGLITCIQFNPFVNIESCNNLLLTSSMDWTIKLWNISPKKTTSSNSIHRLVEFSSPHYDYVCDVKWCPAHPLVFAAITSSGFFLIYNLSESLSTPVVDESIPSMVKTYDTMAAKIASENGLVQSNSTTGQFSAATRISWAFDGSFVLIGDGKGRVIRCNIKESIIRRHNNEETRFEMNLKELSQKQGREEQTSMN